MKKSAQSRRSALIVAAVAAVGLAIVLCIPQALRSAQYSRAEQALASGAYAQAHDGFAGLGAYRDSEALCAYAGALHLLTQGAYAEALSALEGLPGTLDAARYTQYARACIRLEENDFDGARALFASLGDFSDAQARLAWCDDGETAYACRRAELLAEQGAFDDALALLAPLAGRADADALSAQLARRSADAQLARAAELTQSGAYHEALRIYQALGDDARAQGCREQMRTLALEDAAYMLRTGRSDAASAVCAALRGQADVKQMEAAALSARREKAYARAAEWLKDGKFAAARFTFASLGDYRDAQMQVSSCNGRQYSLAYNLEAAGDYAAAACHYRELGDYQDSAARLSACMARLSPSGSEGREVLP